MTMETRKIGIFVFLKKRMKTRFKKKYSKIEKASECQFLTLKRIDKMR